MINVITKATATRRNSGLWGGNKGKNELLIQLKKERGEGRGAALVDKKIFWIFGMEENIDTLKYHDISIHSTVLIFYSIVSFFMNT